MARVVQERRLPLQGGLPPVDLAGTVVEIACDESGFSGTNLLDGATPLFTHASVDLHEDEAGELLGTLRSGFRFSLSELKSGQFLRASHARSALEWMLTSLQGRAHVHVIDKEYFLVTRLVDLFLADPSYAAGTRLTEELRPAALSLHRAGRAHGRPWEELLSAFADLVRTKRKHRVDHDALARFFSAGEALVRAGLDREAVRVLRRLDRANVEAVLVRLYADDRSIPPPLEPLLPALAETVLFWSDGRRRVLVVHDEQSALTADRLRRLQRVLSDETTSPLAGLVTVDSRDDARVQVADLLAGVARRGEDFGVQDLLRPFVSPTSLCGAGG